ncbi:MAG: hypothetical protein JJU02_00140 [Cryomorphaceae bacterium]|nr:hypothetical protein [Cryomorphaceae bacterium]
MPPISLKKPRISIAQIGRFRFWAGIISGVFSAIVISLAFHHTKESYFLVISGIYEIETIEHREVFFRFFLSLLASVLGLSLAIWIWMGNFYHHSQKDPRYKAYARSYIMVFFWLILIALARFSKLAYIMVFLDNQYITIWELNSVYGWTFILLPIVMFFHVWHVVRLVYYTRKWMWYALFTCLLLTFILQNTTSRKNNQSEQWDISLWSQPIPNSNKVIYYYDAWGFIDTHLFGYAITDHKKPFKLNRRKEIALHHISRPPNDSLIEGFALRKNPPFGKRETRIAGTTIITHNYFKSPAYSNSGCGLWKYTFKDFRETRDSIYFFGLTAIFGRTYPEDSIAFPKGSILLEANQKGKIYRLTVVELIPQTGPPHPPPNVPAFCERTYFFDPERPLDVEVFSDFGLFKPVVK